MNRPKAARRTRPRSPERRGFLRYRVPLLLTVVARWNGQAHLLERASTLENISGSGVCFALATDVARKLPENADLEVTIPLVERTFHPARVYARCQARVVRRHEPNWVAAEFNDVEFIREERPSGLPVPLA